MFVAVPQRSPVIAFLFVILLLLSGCAIQLAPDYDEGLVDELNSVNVATLTLFAELEGGSPASAYAGHAEDYAGLIGRFEALRQRAKARYVPPLAAELARKKVFNSFCNGEDNPTACLNVAPESIGEILSNLRTMRDTHSAGGLDPGAVMLFRGRYDIEIDQALTVEQALKR